MPNDADREAVLEFLDDPLALTIEVVSVMVLTLCFILDHGLKALDRPAFEDKVSDIGLELVDHRSKAAEEVENDGIVTFGPSRPRPVKHVVAVDEKNSSLAN
jgi:hypothetical protein